MIGRNSPMDANTEFLWFIYCYLAESDFLRTSCTFVNEAGLDTGTIKAFTFPRKALVTFVQKGLEYIAKEANLYDEIFGEESSLLKPFDLITKDIDELKKIVHDQKKNQQVLGASTSGTAGRNSMLVTLVESHGPLFQLILTRLPLKDIKELRRSCRIFAERTREWFNYVWPRKSSMMSLCIRMKSGENLQDTINRLGAKAPKDFIHEVEYLAKITPNLDFSIWTLDLLIQFVVGTIKFPQTFVSKTEFKYPIP